MAAKKYKPVITKAHIFDGDAELETILDDMEELHCGNCNQLMGLTTGSAKDSDYFRENYIYCNKCGKPVDWGEDE